MPPRRRHLGRAQRGWTEEHLEQLRTGHDFFGDAFGRDDRETFDEELAKQAWDEVGEQITAEHIAHSPGSRPWAWWHFSAPEPRRVVAGDENSESGWPPWEDRTTRKYSYGRPNPIKPPDTAQYDDQHDYLDRLGLLTEDERHAIAVANITSTENE